MKKIKVLEVNKAYYPHTGGIETVVKQYSEELSLYKKLKVKTLVCRDGFGRTQTEKDYSGETYLIRAGSLGTLFSCPLSLSFIRLFRKMSANADIVHIHVPFPLADLALLLSGYKGKVVVSWHSDIVRQKKLLTFYKPLMKYLLNRADYILVATEGHIIHSDFLPEYRSKCRILPYCIDTYQYFRLQRRPFLTKKCTYNDSVKVLFTGRLVYYKGVDVLLRAFTKVNRNCELFIVGTGELEEKLKAMAYKLQIADRVHFLGFLPERELKYAYIDCDIFVLPSVEKSEAFGIVQLEAMICDTPVINTDLPSGVPYVSVHGKTGLTVKPKSPAQLAKAINFLAENPEIRKKLGLNGFRKVLDEHDEDRVIRKLYDFFTEEVIK